MTSVAKYGSHSGGNLELNVGRHRSSLNNATTYAKKNVADDRTGWVVRNGSIRKRTNLELCSRRTVYKTINKYGMLPARKMWLIDMDPLWCFDPYNINSKVLCKMLWTLNNNPMINGVSKEGYHHIMANHKRSWTTPTGHQMMDRMLPIEPMCESLMEEGDQAKERLRALLIRLLIKYGGPVQMSNEERQHRPDAVGSVIKDCHGYSSFPCACTTPIVQCKFCNTYNLYSHIDNGEKPTDTQWRCGACYGDMAYEIIERCDWFMIEANFDSMLGVHGGSQLDALLLTNYGDTYEDLKPDAQASFVAKDKALVLKHFANNYQSVIEIGANLSENEKLNLRLMFPRLYFVFKPRSSHGAKNTMYEMLAMLADVRPPNRKEPTRVYGLNCNDIYPASVCQNCKLDEAEVIVFKNEPVSIRSVLNRPANSVVVLIPKLDCTLTGFDTTMTIGDEIFYQFGSTGTLGTMSNATATTILENDVLIGKTCTYKIDEVQESMSWIMLRITRLSSNSVLREWKKIKRVKPTTIDIPLPDMYGALSSQFAQTWKTTSIKYDPQFLNMLITRNMTGNLSFPSLREFAVGYAMRSYSAQGRVSKNAHIMHDMVDAHTLLALIISASQQASINLNKPLVGLQVMPILKSLLPDLTNEILTIVIEATKMGVSELTGMHADSIWEIMQSVASTAIPKWQANDGNLLKLINKKLTTLSPIMVKRIDTTNQVNKKCLHHHNCDCKTFVVKSCSCCLWAETANQESSLCECCSRQTTMDHRHLEKYLIIDNETTQQGRKIRKTKKLSPTTEDTDENRMRHIIRAANTASTHLMTNATNPEDNKVVTADNIQLSAVMLDPVQYFANYELPELGPYESHVLYSLKNDTVFNPNWFEVTSVNITEDVTGSNCAREAFMQATGIELATDMMVGDAQNMVSAKDILALANHLNVNLLLVHDKGSYITTSRPTNKYATIVHGTLVSTVPDHHYLAGSVRQVSLPRQFPCRHWHCEKDFVNDVISTIDPSMNIDNVGHDVALLADATLASEALDPAMSYDSMIPRTVKVDDEYILSNNPDKGMNNIYAGYVHAAIRPELVAAINLLSVDRNNSHKDVEVCFEYNKYELDIDNLEKDLNTEIRAEIGNWLATINEFSQNNRINQHSVKARHNLTVKLRAGLYVCELKTERIKTLDMVFVSCDTFLTRALVVVDKANNRLILRPNRPLIEGSIKLYQLKSSFSSLLRKISNAGSIDIPFKHCTGLMHNMKLVCGYAGSGKTEWLANNFTDSDVAVAMMGNPVKVIKQRLIVKGKENLTKRVMSLERASTTNTKVSGTIYADEAKQLSLTALIPIIGQDTKSIVLLGDISQAGYVDMLNNVHGERVAFNLTQAVKEKNITMLGNSRRIGYPLAAEIATINDGFVGNNTKTTTFNITHLYGLKEQMYSEMNNLLDSLQPAAVVTATHDMTAELKNATGVNRSTTYSTIFSYQGDEAPVMVLVICPNKNGGWGISRDRSLLISAMTRPTEHLEIVVMNSDAKETKFVDLVSVMGNALFNRKMLNEPVALQQAHANLATANYPGTSINITSKDDVVTYEISAAYGMITSSMHYANDKLIITGDNKISHMLRKTANDENIEIGPLDERIDSMNLDRMRALAWVVDKLISDELGWEFYDLGYYYKLTKTKSCPYNAGLKLEVKMTHSNVSKWHHCWTIKSPPVMGYTGVRTLAQEHLTATAAGMLGWLEVQIHGRQFMDQSFLDSLRVPSGCSATLRVERLKQTPLCLLQVMSTCKCTNHCKHQNKLSNASILRIQRSENVDFNREFMHAVAHRLLVVKKKTLLMGTPLYTFYVDGFKTKDVKTYWSGSSQIAMLQELIDDIASIEEKPTINGELEGLHMSMAKHKTHNTAAYKAYRDKLSAIKSYTIDALDNTIWVSKGREDDSRMLVQNMGTNVFVNTHNLSISDIMAELLDGHMIISKGSLSKDTVITYAGLEPALPAIYNKHYLKLWRSQSSTLDALSPLYKYEEALNSLNSYYTAIAEEGKVKLDHEATATFVNDHQFVGSRVLIGTALMYYTYTELVDLLNGSANELWGYVPTPDLDERLAQINYQSGSMFVVSNYRGLISPINLSLYHQTMGWVNPPMMPNNSYVMIEVVDVILGMAFVRVTQQRHKPKAVVSLAPIDSGNNVTVELPWMNTDLKTVLSTGKLITKQKITIKPHLFRSLSMRLMLDTNVKLTDVMAYARTLGSAYETSESNFKMKYSVDVDVLKYTAYAAWYNHKQMGNKYAVASKMWDAIAGNSNDALVANLVALLTELLAGVAAVSNVLNLAADWINEAVRMRTIECGLPLNWLAACDDVLKLKLSTPSSSIRPFNLTVDEVEIDDGSGPDDDSSDWDPNNHSNSKKNEGPADSPSNQNDESTGNHNEKQDDGPDNRDDNEHDGKSEDNNDPLLNPTNLDMDVVDALNHLARMSANFKERLHSMDDADILRLARAFNDADENAAYLIGNNTIPNDLWIKVMTTGDDRVTVNAYRLRKIIMDEGGQLIHDREEHNNDDENSGDEEDPLDEYNYEPSMFDDSLMPKKDDDKKDIKDDKFEPRPVATPSDPDNMFKLSTMLKMFNSYSSKNPDYQMLMKFAKIMADSSNETKNCRELIANLRTDHLKLTNPMGTQRHVLVIATGSTGEIVPLLKLATLLMDSELYRVTFCCQPDAGLTIPVGMGYSQINLNVYHMQQAVISLNEKPLPVTATKVSHMQQVETLKAALRVRDVSIVISNVITYAATTIGKKLGAQVLITTPAIERSDDQHSVDRFNSIAFSVDERIAVKPILAAALYNVTNVLDANIEIQQLDDRKRPIMAMFPREWLELYKGKHKFNYEAIYCPALTNNDKDEPKPLPKCDLLILAGSTFGSSWRNIMKSVLNMPTRLRIVLVISLLDVERTILDATGMTIEKIPKNILIKEWVDYTQLCKQTIITHGGAGVTLAMTRRENRALVLPMLGDNFTNAEWLKNLPFIRVADKDDPGMAEHITWLFNLQFGKIPYVTYSQLEQKERVTRWIRLNKGGNVTCKCPRQHVLAHFIGTRGDLNSFVPAVKLLTANQHVVCITHNDLLHHVPTGWLKIPLNSDSAECAQAAVDALSTSATNIMGPLKHYRRLASDSKTAVDRVNIECETIYTTFFTPLSYTIGNKFQCKVVLIDAIPNSPLYIKDREITTNLPISITETGNIARHEVMSTIDNEAMKFDTAWPPHMEIVTCNKNLYQRYLPPNGINALNLFVNNDVTNVATGDLKINTNKFKLLVTFGSIACESRATKLVDWADELTGVEIHWSGEGNFKTLFNEKHYHRLLNYPSDLQKFDCVLHHGGVGTTWNCVRARVPQLIWPIFGDQYNWSAIVNDQGLGYSIQSINDVNTAIEAIRTNKNSINDIVREAAEEMTKPYIDDAAQIIRELVGKNEIDVARVWPFKFEPLPGETKMECGQYEIDAHVSETIINPSDISGCVPECLKHIGLLTNDSDYALNIMAPTLDELTNILHLYCINHVMFINSKFHDMQVRSSGHGMIELNVTQTGGGWHCTVVLSTKHGTPKIKHLTNAKWEEIYSASVQREVMNIDESLHNIVMDLGDIRNTKYANLVSTNINTSERMSRRSNPICESKVIQLAGLHNVYSTLGSSQWANLGIYLCRNTNGSAVAMLLSISLSDRTILVCLNECPLITRSVHAILVDKLMVEASNTIKSRVATNEWLFINNAARKSNTDKKYNHCKVLRNQTRYRLLVNCVDNSQHDKFNYQKIISQAMEYKLMGNTKKEDFVKAFMSDRKIYYNKDIYEKLDNQPNNMAQVRYMMKLERSQLTARKFNSWYSRLIYERKTYNANIGNNYPPSTTWASIKEHLDSPTIMFLESRFVLDDNTVFIENKKIQLTDETIVAAVAQGAIVTSEYKVVVSKPLRVYETPEKQVSVKGAGLLTSKYDWTQGSQTETKMKDWWGLANSTTNIGEERSPPQPNVLAMSGHLHADMQGTLNAGTESGLISGFKTQHVENQLYRGTCTSIEYVEDMVDFDAMVFWTDSEMTNWLNMYAPFESKVKSTEWPQRLTTVEKHSLTKYPKYARAVHTKVSFEEHRSIVGRLFSIKTIRTTRPTLNDLMCDMTQAYFHDRTGSMISKFQKNKLYYDPEGTEKWIDAHKNTAKVILDLKETLTSGLHVSPISDIKVHLKLESLLKDANKVIHRWEQQKARIIVWQRYAVAAIFAPIFNEAKKRLHSLLNNKVVYADSKTPEQLASFMRGTNPNTKYCMSTDLEQQDRQTDEPIIELEFEIYKILGVHEDVLSAWRSVHGEWRFKGAFTKGYRKAMRLSGQATTSLGNVITNMQTHAKFIAKNQDLVTFVLMLGDDNCVGMLENTDVKTFQRYISNNFNMVAKSSVGRIGDFCHFVVYKTQSGYWELGPDYVRLKNRYEVTNGASEMSDENMRMRSMSYAMTIGATPEILSLIKSQGLPITPTMWYDEAAARSAMELKHGMSTMEIQYNYEQLLHMMTSRPVYTHTTTFMSSKPRKI